MEVYTDIDELIATIRRIPPDARRVVSVDGVDGVGKSTFARRATEVWSALHVEVDTLVQAERGGYLEFVDYEHLSLILSRSITSGRSSVVDGICVQQVLRRIDLTPDVSVYVRIVDRYGFCDNEIRLFPSGRDVDDVINERRIKGFPLGHTEDVIRYHYAFMPHATADFVLERRR